jgi:hypothetical protein
MKKTYKEFKDIDILIGKILKRNPAIKNSKFGYACEKFAEKNYVSVAKKLIEKIYDIRLQNALEDPQTKEVKIDTNPASRGFKFSKEGLINCIKQEREIIEEFDKKEIEIEPYFCISIPEEITKEEKEKLKGLLINENILEEPK